MSQPSPDDRREGPGVITRDQAVQAAGRILAVGRAAGDAMSPRELAEAAWHAGCGKTVDQLEAEIAARRHTPLADTA